MSLTEGSKVWYRFDTGSGETVYDRSKSFYTNDGTKNSYATWVSGEDQMDFSGDGDGRVSLPRGQECGCQYGFAISVYFKVDSLSSAGCLFSDFGSHWTFLYVTDTGRVKFGSYSSETDQWIYTQTAENEISTGVWYHVVVTNSTINNQTELWLDGVSKDTTTPENTYTAAETSTVGTDTYYNFRFDGQMEDVRFFGDPLTDSEVQSLYTYLTGNYSIDDYSSKKKLAVTSVSGSPTISRVMPLKLKSGDPSTTGVGEIVLDWTNISGKDDIGIYDENGNLLDYCFESFDLTNQEGIVWVYDDWVRDDTIQTQVAYGSGPGDFELDYYQVFKRESDVVAGYPLDESSGQVRDVTMGNHAANQGATYGATGRVDGAYDFDGVDDYLQTTYLSTEMNNIGSGTGSKFTISAWIKPDHTGEMTIAQKTDENDSGPWPFMAMVNQGGGDQVCFIQQGTGDWEMAYSNTGNQLQAGTWYLMTWVYNSGTVYFYMNATNIGSDTVPDKDTSNAKVVRIGRRSKNDGSGASYVDGILDNLFIRNTALSADEVKALYDAGQSIPDFFSQAPLLNEIYGAASISVAPSLSSTPKRTREASSNPSIGIQIVGDETRVRPGEGAITTGLNMEGIVKRLRDGKGSLSVGLDVDSDAGAVRDGESSITVSPNLLGTIKRIRKAFGNPQISLQMTGTSDRKRGGEASITFALDMAGTIKRLRDMESSMSLDFSLAAVERRLREAASSINLDFDAAGDAGAVRDGQTEIIMESSLTAQPLKVLWAAAHIQTALNVQGSLNRIRFGESTISIDLAFTADIEIFCSITVAADMDAVPTVMKHASSGIQVVADLAAELKRIRKSSSSIQTDITFSGATIRRRDAEGPITVELDLDAEGDILGQVRCEIVLDVDTQATAGLVREVASAVEVVPDLVGEVKRIREASAEIQADLSFEGANIRKRYNSGDIELQLDFEAAGAGILGGTSDISLVTNLQADPKRIRDMVGAIDVIPDITGTINRIRETSSDIQIDLSFEGAEIRQRNTSGDIELQLDFEGEGSRFRGISSDISIVTNMQATPKRLRQAVGAIEVALDLLGDPRAVLGGASNIEIGANLAGAPTRMRIGESSTEITIDLEGEGGLLTLAMTFSGSFAPGDTIEIDTDNLTILDSEGNNLRSNFDINDWIRAHPEGTTLWWVDEESGRTIEIEITKEDREL